MNQIEKIIDEKLNDIEEKENVKILHAVESGSRAWGFASPDSDYDVRFIYVRKKEDYLSLNQKRDVIEWQLDEILDINGWDLKKALQHFHKSNATLFEWSNSPIVYRTTKEWQSIYSQAQEYFSVKSSLYHYYGTANSNFYEYLQEDEVKYKKYFYVIRPLLACKYIMEHISPPPVLFSELMKQELPHEIKQKIQELLEVKASTPEAGKGQRIDILNQYIEKELGEYKEYVTELEDDRIREWDILDSLFINSSFYTPVREEGDIGAILVPVQMLMLLKVISLFTASLVRGELFDVIQKSTRLPGLIAYISSVKPWM